MLLMWFIDIENDPEAAIHLEKWFSNALFSSNVIDLTANEIFLVLAQNM